VAYWNGSMRNHHGSCDQMKTLFKYLIVLLVVSTCAACTGTPVNMGSRGAIPAVNAADARTITSEACGFQLLLFIPIALNSRAERAYKDLEAQAAGDFITDVQVQERWSWGFVGTSYCTVIQAKAVPPNKETPKEAAPDIGHDGGVGRVGSI
jgi:hypothetical protein